MDYTVTKRLLHDGQRYMPGNLAPELMKLDAERLLALGVIKPVGRPERKAESGKRKVESGKPEAGSGKRKVESGKPEAGSGKRKAESGKPKAGKGAGLPDGIDPKLL
jgi:hypothetical protein